MKTGKEHGRPLPMPGAPFGMWIGRMGRQANAVARRPVIDWMGKIAQAGSIFKNRRLLLGAATAVVVLILIVAGCQHCVSRYTLLAAKQTATPAFKTAGSPVSGLYPAADAGNQAGGDRTLLGRGEG